MKIAVCCSSSNQINEKYNESSKELLNQIFKQENDLVFGAMNSGIMGIAYELAKKYNRNIIGITPKIFKDDFKDLDCNTEILTKNITDRTSGLINNSDALIFLPGGIGTLYELMTAIEMKRSKEFDKPIIIYNETGFFNEILKSLDKGYKEHFINSNVLSTYKVANDCKTVMNLLEKIK